MRTIRSFAIVLLCLFPIAVLTPGCVSQEDITAVKQSATSLSADVDRSIARAETALATSKAAGDDATSIRLLEIRDNLQATKDSIQTDLRKIEADWASVLDGKPDATEKTALDSLVGLVPEPFRGPVTVIGGVGLLVWRSKRLKDALKSVASSFEKARREIPELAAVLERPDVRASLRSTQTPLARAVVNGVQGKPGADPIPVI
jgi:Sec-independent protein translocase protein TatA